MCISPIHLKDPQGYYFTTSCGQCRQCRLRRKLSWVGRLKLESQCHHTARFLTLTYNKSSDPGILPPEHIRDFLKRYRYHYGPMRYFVVGEYGDKNARPHWHCVIFGHPPADPNNPKWLDNQAWDLGFSDDRPVIQGCFEYVASYMLKNGDDKQFRPVIRQSLKPGIGFQRIIEMAKASPKNLTGWPTSYYIGSKKYPLCAGGLARFQTTYLEEGGIPPFQPSPITRHYTSVLLPITEGDTYFEKKSLSSKNHERDNDGQALPREASKRKLAT